MPPTSPTQTKPPVTPPTPADPKVVNPVTEVTPGDGPKCGKPVQTKIKGVVSSKPCVKPAGHDTDPNSKHSIRVYKTVDTSVIKLDDVRVESFDEGERVTVLTDPGTRSEIQKRIDADVAEAYAAWKAQGKPDTLKSALAAKYERDGKRYTVAKRYWVNPEQEAAWRKMLRSAASINGVQVRIYPVQKHAESGRHQLPWFARDMRERKTKDDKRVPGTGNLAGHAPGHGAAK